jgi:uncharacterized protein
MNKPLTFLLSLTFLFLFSGSVFGDDMQDGVDALQRKDYKTAFRLWKPLAEQGYTQAQSNLGMMYDKGHGVPQDYKEAVKWFRLSAEKGLAQAQSNLGVMYYGGRGVPQDYKEAVKWFRLSAEQGYAVAQSNLGAMYVKGQGVPKDYVLSHMWANLAASNGNKYGIKYRDILEKEMTPSQIAEAQQLVRNWKPKK